MNEELQGFAPGLDHKLLAGIESGLLRDLHAVAVARQSETVLEHYFEGEDFSWGDPLGVVAFGPDTLHDLRSVTKSIASLLYGIALDKGLVPPPEAGVVAQFPEYPDLVADPARRDISIGHALSMTMGLEWDESLPYTSAANSEIAMEQAPDRFRFILDRPVVQPPGQTWTYSGGAVALIGALITRGTGKSLTEFAREHLFEPLGITDYYWMAGADGVESAASGLRLSTRSLLAIGTMLVNGGRHGDRQVVPAGWLETAFAPATQTSDGLGYGRLFFLGEAPVPAFDGPTPWIGGFGNGGQRLWLMPKAGLACVTFAGAYDHPENWITPTRVWREIVLRNLVRG
jgi:CubicO group peptidase (beta-lactamase class C family)